MIKYTITKTDIGKRFVKFVTCQCCGRAKTYSLADSIGYVMPRDVGGELHLRNDIIYFKRAGEV